MPPIMQSRPTKKPQRQKKQEKLLFFLPKDVFSRKSEMDCSPHGIGFRNHFWLFLLFSLESSPVPWYIYYSTYYLIRSIVLWLWMLNMIRFFFSTLSHAQALPFPISVLGYRLFEGRAARWCIHNIGCRLFGRGKRGRRARFCLRVVQANLNIVNCFNISIICCIHFYALKSLSLVAN